MKRNTIAAALLASLFLSASASTSVAVAQVGARSPEENRAALAAVKVGEPNADAVLFDANLALWDLAQTGTSAEVPLIAPLLATDELNAAARTALQNIPGEEARAALRDSLQTLEGTRLSGVVQSLAALGDVESFVRIAALTDSADETVALAATDAAAKLGVCADAPDELRTKAQDAVAKQLKNASPNVRAAAVDGVLRFVERERTAENADAASALLARLDAPELELSDASRAIVAKAKERVAGRKLEPSPRPVDPTEYGTAAELADLLKRRAQAAGDERAALSDEAFQWCRRVEPLVGYEEVLSQALAETTDSADRDYLFALLVQVGTQDALRAVAATLREANEANADAVTRVLGEWLTLDAKPYLTKLATEYPVEKYRVRALRGYVRLVRQMFDVAEPKIAAIDEILPFVKTGEDRKLLAETLDSIEKARRDRVLFDGKTFGGWEGNLDVFKIENGCVVGGYVDKPIPRNEFLCTTERFRDFTLTLECKIEGDGGNAGVQFRSERIPNDSETIGYQADMTEDGAYWGSLYDESRRRDFLAKADPELVKKLYKPGDWNEYKIVCWGAEVQLYLNGVKTVDYVETDPNIPRDGIIGLQIHQGGPSRSFYRNVRIETYEPRIVR